MPSGSYTSQQLTTLLNELNNDPESLGYAAYIPGGGVNPDVVSLAALLNWIRDGVTPCPNNGVVGSSGTITNATNATPIVITSANHGRSNGDTVVVSGVLGNTNADGTFVVQNVTTNSFSLATLATTNGSTLTSVAGNAAYTSGGTWAWCVNDFSNVTLIPAQGATSFGILNAFVKADLNTATPSNAECAWANMLASLFAGGTTQVPLLTNGSENNIIGNLKGFIGSAQTTSIANLEALKYRLGSRAEQILNIASTGTPGNVISEIDVQAAFAGHY
jgi:hypothetical protein